MNEIIHYLKFKNLLKNWEKSVFPYKKCNFEHIENSVHTTKFFSLGKALNIFIDYFMFYPDRQHVKW